MHPFLHSFGHFYSVQYDLMRLICWLMQFILSYEMAKNVRPIMAPRCRPSLQHVFIPLRIRAYFDLKVGDLLKFDVVENRIVIKIIRKDK